MLTVFSKEKRILILLFFLSGISGLVYKVVWLRMLSRVLGVTTYATSITIAAFMAGLGIGSYIFGKFSDRLKSLLKLYALLEMLIAITAVITPFLFQFSVPLYKGLYELSDHNRPVIMLLRCLVSFLTLLIPTTLMGGTLPVLTGYLTKKDRLFGNNLSLLYGFNTFGAVTGVLLSGFITIGKLGEWKTILLGVAVNLLVSGTVLIIGIKTMWSGAGTEAGVDGMTAKSEPDSLYSGKTRTAVLIFVLISGFTALAYEVIWTRQLILYLQVSVYAFSAMLAVFLLGIASGSLFANKMLGKKGNRLIMFGTLQLALSIVSLISLYIFPLFNINKYLRLLSPIYLVFPTAFIFGMIFPVAAVCYAGNKDEIGGDIGTIYSFNTAGNVLGSIVTGFIFISLIGSTKTIMLLAAVNMVVGISLLFIAPDKTKKSVFAYGAAAVIIVLLMAGALNKDVFLDVLKNRISKYPKSEIYYNKEGVQGTVTSCYFNDSKVLEINGVGQTSLCTETKLMAHLPVLFADKPDKMLIICFGMGTILESAVTYGNIDITISELVPEVYKCFGYYHKNAAEILKYGKLNLNVEDGRNFLLLSSDKYDMISIDPSPPIYSAGTVNLYTREFLELCKEHLTPGGVMCMWFPGGTKLDNRMILRTFFTVFPESIVWKGPNNWGFYMLGKLKKMEIDAKKIRKAFADKKIVEDLSEYDKSCVTADQLLALYLGNPETIGPKIEKYPVITDNHPYTEFVNPVSLFFKNNSLDYTNGIKEIY